MFSAAACTTVTVASSVSGVSSGAGRRRHVDQGRPGVDLGLRHRVRRRVGPGLADLQQAVVVAAASTPDDRPGIRRQVVVVTTTPVIVVLPVLATVIV